MLPSSDAGASTSAQSRNSAHLARVRDNQRRSRARRKEYLQELEDKFRRCEQTGVEASAEMQTAARRVLEENQRLRAILREKGVTDEEMDGLTAAPGETASASTSLENLMNSRRACGSAGPSSTCGSVPSPSLSTSEYSPSTPMLLPHQAPQPQWQRGSVSSVSSQQNVSMQPLQHQQQQHHQHHQRQQIHPQPLTQPHSQSQMPPYTYASADPSSNYAMFDMYNLQQPLSQQQQQQHQQSQRLHQQQHPLVPPTSWQNTSALTSHSLSSSYPGSVSSGYTFTENDLTSYGVTDPSQVQVQDLLPPEVQAQFLRSLHMNVQQGGGGHAQQGRGQGQVQIQGVSKTEDSWSDE